MIFENAQEKQLLLNVFDKATWNNVNTMDADIILRARYLITNAKLSEKKHQKEDKKVVEVPTEPPIELSKDDIKK